METDTIDRVNGGDRGDDQRKGAGKMTGKEALEIIVRKHCVSETDEEDEELEKCYKQVKADLNVLEILKNILDANTLFRVFPYKTAKSFSDFIKAEEKVKEWLKQ